MLSNNVSRGHALRIVTGITVLAIVLTASGIDAVSAMDDYTGAWAGTYDVKFNVSNSTVNGFEITIPVQGSDCPASYVTYVDALSHPIIDNKFQVNNSPGFFNGTFTSADTANGTFRFSGSSCYGEVIWNASRFDWTSPDWIKTYLTDEWLENTAFVNNNFVTVGTQGMILTSNDGINWINRTSWITRDLSGVAYGNGAYVITAWDGTIYTSTDLQTWIERNAGDPVNYSKWLSNIAYGNGTFVTVGATIFNSDDGIGWMERTPANYNFSGLAYVNNTFVAVGDDMLVSNDGITWVEMSPDTGTPSHLSGISYGNGVFVVTGNNGIILTSTDMVNWTKRDFGVPVWLDKVAFGNGSFIVVGDSGTILTSTDGIAWKPSDSGTAGNLAGVAYGNGRFVVVGDGKILTSAAATSADVTPPGSVTSLRNTTLAETYINWTWIDPPDPDFSHIMIYFDGAFQRNITKGTQFYNTTGLTPDTEHTIATRTVDTSGNINSTWTNNTARTAAVSLADGKINISSCTVISSPGTYVLNKSIINSTNSTCIRITSSDVVLDGAGSTIDGVDGFETNGVYAFNESKNIKNVTVKNLTVTDWYYGINYNCAQGGEISNNNARSNTNAGIYLDGSGGSILINNSVSSSNYGIYLDGSIRFTLNNNTRNSSKNILINNNVSLSKYAGIYLLGSKENTLTGNNASSNSDGISLNEYSGTLRVNEGGQFVTYSLTAYSSDNILDGNIAINNSDTGISLRSSDNNTLTVNAARSNKIGFSLSNSSNNTLIDNTADSNRWYGFTLWYSSNNNTLSGNNASNNEDGIRLQSSGNNTLKNNRMRNNSYNFELYGSKDSDFENTIDADNTIDDKPIYYMKRKTNAVYDGSSNAGVFYCIWCWNVTVKDMALSGNSHGVFFWRTNNSRIENINTSRNQESGIKIDRSFNNSLINNTVISNTQGIFLGYSDNNSLFNNTAISNGVQGGVYLSYSNYNFLTDNIVKSNKGVGGIYLEYSIYNMIIDNIISHNMINGLNLYYSGHNILSNNSLRFNGGGFDLMNSNENTIMNNNISSNYGNSVYSSNNNTIYNNYFNNTNNIISYGMISGNYWNITRTAGANIIGGYTLGGNFWADLNGTGISQICPDADMDGICDSSYALDSNNTDHLPLSSAQVIIDITPPASISNLRNISYATNYINWTWIDPIDTDFSYTIVYLDGSYRTNISKGIQFYNITGFSDSSVHTISTRTVDMAGNLNLTWVNHTATTSQASQPYDILSYYRSLGSNPNVLETTDLLRAADDWSNDRVAPGFSAPITTQQLLALADEWSKT